MKSIKTKILVIVLSGIIAVSIIAGGFSVLWSNNAVKKDSSEILDLMTQVQAQGLNSMFADIEQSSSVLAYYFKESFKNFKYHKRISDSSQYISSLKNTAWYIANCTNHIISVYIKFSPELSQELSDFYWTKKKSFFIPGVPSESSQNDSNFSGNWYSKAMKYGSGIWTQPYYNEDINEYVVTYGLPVYNKQKIIAVIGMDVDFDDIAAIVNSISVYNSGYAFLTDKDFTILYHRKIPSGTKLLDNVTEFKKINVRGSDIEIYKYTKLVGPDSRGKEHFRMAYKNLTTGMKLVVSVPAHEIDRDRNRLILTLILSALAISLLVSVWSIFMSSRISKPLKELAGSARNIIAGNYELKFSRIPDDEIGDLMGIFSFMATSLKRQFDYINGLAYLDAMTGVKNKRAFIDARDEIDKKIALSRRQNEKFEFALVVFDVNNLKYINDNFGHKAGDTLIKSACNLIMKNFVYSSVFRIGGDEFVSVLTDKDYKNREELIKNLYAEMNADSAKKEGFVYAVSLAAGLSVYDPAKDENFQSVFERADEEMYRAKIEMKGGLGR